MSKGTLSAERHGVVLDLAVTPGVRSVQVTWTGAESERTTYELTSDSTLAATCEVVSGGRYAVYARSTLRRMERADCPKGAAR
jgi:hypothetical protein